MGYQSQAVLVLTDGVDRRLRSAIDGADPESLRVALRDRFNQALHLASSRHGQVLYFWDWTTWRRTGEVAQWLDAVLGDLPADAYQLRLLGERDGDDRVDGELEDAFQLASRRFLDLDPEPDTLYQPRSAYERLLDSARILAAAHEGGARDGHMDWDEIDEAHQVSRPALRFLTSK